MVKTFIQTTIKILIVVGFVFLGYYRDHLFVNLNYQLTTLYYHNSDFKLPSSLFFLEGMDYMTLYYLKYVFTGLFILLFFANTLLAVKFFLKEKKYYRWVIYSYIIITFGAGLLFISVYIFTDFNTAYTPTRKIMEFAESPLMAMLLFPVMLLHKKLNKEPDDEQRN